MATPDLTRLLTGFQGALIMNPTAPTPPGANGPVVNNIFSATGFTPGVHRTAQSYVYASGESGLNSNLGGGLTVGANNGLRFSNSAPLSPNPLQTGYYLSVAGAPNAGPYYLLGYGPGSGAATDFTGLTDAQLVLQPGAPSGRATAFPYGGTQLGEVMDTVVLPRRLSRELTGEETGPETIEVVDAGESWKITAAIRGFDPDLYALLMSVTTSTGAVSGRPVVKYPGAATQAGAFLTQRSGLPFIALLAPKDVTRLPSFIFYAMIPVLDASARLSLQLDREGMLGAVFHCLRANANGQPRDKQVIAWGMLEDLSFT